MKRIIHSCVALGLAAVISAAAMAAPAVSVRTKSGATWRGELNTEVKLVIKQGGMDQDFSGKLIKVGDGFVVVEGLLAGKTQQRTIFIGDIVKMETAGATAASSSTPSTTTAAPVATGAASATTPATAAANGTVSEQDFPGVFYLPLEGGVGEEIRYNEIEAIGKEADKFGPGQIIILMINTNGGLVLESELIDETIEQLQKRHRVIGWVKKAISAGCSLAMACSEIYFMTEGTAGSVTTVSGATSLPEEMVISHIEAFAETARRNGYSEHIARAMKLNRFLCSYDKDPVTGKITWYGDLSGEFILSDEVSNLCFNSSNALHCNFSKGTADTQEDLAKLLNLPKWKEVNDSGRRMAESWLRTCKEAQEGIPLAFARYEYKNTGQGDQAVILGTRIAIINDLIRWWNRAPNVARMQLPEKERLEREVAELRKQLADLQRRRRAG